MTDRGSTGLGVLSSLIPLGRLGMLGVLGELDELSVLGIRLGVHIGVLWGNLLPIGGGGLGLAVGWRIGLG